jgi:hypothetical protein
VRTCAAHKTVSQKLGTAGTKDLFHGFFEQITPLCVVEENTLCNLHTKGMKMLFMGALEGWVQRFAPGSEAIPALTAGPGTKFSRSDQS